MEDTDDMNGQQEEMQEPSSPQTEEREEEPSPVLVEEESENEVQEAGGCNLCALLEEMRQNEMYQRISAIFHWRDVIESGLVFSIGNFIYFLLSYGEYTVLSLHFLLIAAVMAVAGVFIGQSLVRAKLKSSEMVNPLMQRFGSRRLGLSTNSIEQGAALAGLMVNFKLYLAREIVFWNYPVLSGAIFFGLLFGAIFCNYVGGLTILYVTFLGLFVWPRVYEMKQTQIDQVYEMAKAKVMHFYGIGISKIPPDMRQKLKLE